ncbi:ribosome biogenesis factor YjgA [Porticoccus litoralis]|uniref:Dual-action ribosomal maturation protein DarP n=1 Tax=Porticoccus litoralis TaxID=434086 RepID=A0AAW8B4M7_9GAMM|nr:ribosome biogenesis factor YjgA [Porticoccus litoralis]MDP1520078.1 ribosome biogenesis factor YjgA [Porticoccus litoralis]
MSNTDDFPELTPDEELPKSKTAIKREMTELQKLGEELVNLPAAKLEKISLPEDLEEAVMLARRLKNREGKRRQLQYIGKLMRVIDSDSIRESLESFHQDSVAFRQQFHKLEIWRDRLLNEGDSALEELMREKPGMDRQHLRQLIRQAQKQASQNKPPAAARKLFKYLRENS